MSLSSGSAVRGLIPVVEGGHLYTSTDSGATWVDRSTGTIAGNKLWISIAISNDGQKLAVVIKRPGPRVAFGQGRVRLGGGMLEKSGDWER